MEGGAATVAGWDIGGVNVKAARLDLSGGRVAGLRVTVRPFEIWRSPAALPDVLVETARAAGVDPRAPLAVTMTAELSDAFVTRSEGVLSVLAAVEAAFSAADVRVLDVDGRLVSPPEARARPLRCAATNWVASALAVAEQVADCILVDVGSTTTDIIPIRGGRIAAEGHSDSARLAAGELVYTGVLRTNPNTIVSTVPLRGRPCRVAAEWFTQMADAHLLLGRLAARDYTCPTPDGRGTTADEARARLARLVCEDAETQSRGETLAIARHLFERQVSQVADGLQQVLSRHPGDAAPVLPAGVGAFLAAEAGRRLGLATVDAAFPWREAGSAALPASAVAVLLAGHLGHLRP